MRPVVAYGSPFVPPEWIAAFGFTPRRVVPARGLTSGREGLCPWAAAMSDELGHDDVAGAITVSTCDQLRRQSESIRRPAESLMLMNVPATWQGDAPRRSYRSELERVGRFLVALGGKWPDREALAEEMRRYDQARAALRPMGGVVSARKWQEAMQAGPEAGSPGEIERRRCTDVPLAVIGGPLCREDRWILDLLEQLGGRVALDATETGERCLPAPYDDAIAADPMEAMVRAYFDAIPDAFRRPDALLQEYLAREVAARGVRGVALVRYPWCDQWHAQAAQLKGLFAMPVVEIDLSGSDGGGRQRISTRLETLIRIVQ